MKSRKRTTSKGSISKRVVIKRTGNVRKTLHDEEEEETLPSGVKHGESVCWVQASAGVTRSANYQSVTISVGGEMPFKCEPGDMKAFTKGLRAFESVIETHIAKKFDEIDDLLEELAKNA